MERATLSQIETRSWNWSIPLVERGKRVDLRKPTMAARSDCCCVQTKEATEVNLGNRRDGVGEGVRSH